MKMLASFVRSSHLASCVATADLHREFRLHLEHHLRRVISIQAAVAELSFAHLAYLRLCSPSKTKLVQPLKFVSARVGFKIIIFWLAYVLSVNYGRI